MLRDDWENVSVISIAFYSHPGLQWQFPFRMNLEGKFVRTYFHSIQTMNISELTIMRSISCVKW